MADWQAGDLALCVNAGPVTCDCGERHDNRSGKVRQGVIYTVASVIGASAIDHLCALGGCDCPLLVTECGHGALTKRFRKIHPHAPDAEDEITIRLLNRQPVPEDA